MDLAFLFSHTACLVLLTGWLLDLLFGDPMWLPHPIVYMGRWISFWEHRLNHGTHRLVKGAVFAIMSIVCTFVLAWFILFDFSTLCSKESSVLYFSLFTFHFSLLSLAVFFCLAGHTLRREVRMVFEALDRSLDEGRRQVARIVGRDTQQLSAQEVRTAALETLAENLSDGVIAPLFWFAVLGLPGMLTYKMINTMDSMIGYRNDRYKDFGCWAARIDDIANFLPARLTALLMLLAATLYHITSRSFRSLTTFHFSLFTFHFSLSSFHFSLSSFHFVLQNAKRHASPNSGWPEAALACILDCRFGGTHNYFGQAFYKPYIGTNARALTTDDMHVSLHVCFCAEVLAVISIILILLL